MNTAPVNDTIAAISTPPGPGGVGMVRISGPEALVVGQGIFRPLADGPSPASRPLRAVVGHVHRPGHREETIDQALWLCFHGPSSYTGEDVVELTAHGGPLIMRGILEAAVLAGARLAEPGEFTRRAFLNGRMDLSQAEAVASLIAATTDEARRVMLRQVEGAMGREAASLRNDLLDVKVALESAIDFPEDVEGPEPDAISHRLGVVRSGVLRLLDTARGGIAMKEGLRIVIVGAPNVGKSSLLNALLDEERAIVHEAAGTTRDFIEGRLSVEGIPLVVVDTAGIREGPDSLEEEGINRTRRLMERADMLLVVLDGSRSLIPGEKLLLADTAAVRRLVAVNKCDLPSHRGFRQPEGSVRISALKGEGVGDLKRALYDAHIGAGPSLAEAEGVVTSVRQEAALRRILEGCTRALEGVRETREPELLAVDVQEALAGIGELTGEITTDEVMDEIFSRFCIGK